MAGESGEVAEVTQQGTVQVRFSASMVGFPPGFQLRPGERVVLVHDESGMAIRPLVRSMTVDAISEEEAGVLSVGDQRFTMQESTVRDDQGDGGPYEVFVVERGSAEGPEQVIAVRSVPQRR